MSAKHTPGPWRVRPNAANWRAVCDAIGCSASEAVLSEDTAVALVVASGPHPFGKVPPTKFNARLIAAAPDLLVALQDLVALLPDPELDDDDVQKALVRNALAAIAKAEGA